jgi:hypothetical protein
LQVHPQGVQPLFKVSFSDGSSTLVTKDHLWLYGTTTGRLKADRRYYPFDESDKVSLKITTTHQIQKMIEKRSRWSSKCSVFVPCSKSVLIGNDGIRGGVRTIDPYVLGVLIGDGCLTQKTITFTSADDDVVTGSQFKQAMQMMAGALAPVQQTQDQMAQYALNQTRQKFPKEFQKYEAEIYQQIHPLPRSAWTLDNLQLAVELVAGRHRHELAQEMAREMAANQGLTLRTDGFANHTPMDRGLTLESEKLPADYKERLAKQGISLNTVREFCAASGQSVQEWFKQAEKLGSSVMGGN